MGQEVSGRTASGRDRLPEADCPVFKRIKTGYRGRSRQHGNNDRMETMTEAKIEYLEILTRLELTGEERETLKEDLDQMIAWIGKSGEADTAGLKEAACGTDAVNVFREDEVYSSMGREALLENAPEQKNGMIMVPAVL